MVWTEHALTELMARRYLASRGEKPLVDQPLALALPQLEKEVNLLRRGAKRDAGVAAGLGGAGVVSTLVVWISPHQGSALQALLHMYLVSFAGLAAVIWAAIVLERSGPQWRLSQKIGCALRSGSLLEALGVAMDIPDGDRVPGTMAKDGAI